MNAAVSLISINPDGTLRGYAEALPGVMGEVLLVRIRQLEEIRRTAGL
ncbi:MAG: hypothetical protein ACREQV_01675 [Candidatus Binatia bacterium]